MITASVMKELKMSVKLAEDFNIFMQEAIIRRGKYEGEININ